MKNEKLVDLFYALIILWLCCIIIMVVLLIKGVGKIEKHTTISTGIKDTTNEVIKENDDKTENNIETQNNIEKYTSRLTSFYANDGYGTGSCTGSGLCENNFQVNENGWYIYQDKLVIGAATTYMLNYKMEMTYEEMKALLPEDVILYSYFDEIKIIIDGIEYQAIILDSCGACMSDNRIDLFVSNRESVKDTIVEVIK